MNTPAPSPKLTPDQMHAVLTDWHAHYCDDPLYVHFETSFEDVADQLWAAMKNLKAAQEEADWEARTDDVPGFSGTWLGLRELSGVAA